jgi:hypothetical protein
MMKLWIQLLVGIHYSTSLAQALSMIEPLTKGDASLLTRRHTLGWIAAAAIASVPLTVHADSEMPDRFDVDQFLRTGIVPNPMGVSGQAGKSRPETGVLLRDGTEVAQNAVTGEIAAEILVQDSSGTLVPVLVSYASPWPLATGSVFDVECRDMKTGDGAFVAVTTPIARDQSLATMDDGFLLKNIFAPTGRFSTYGSPTDIKVRKSSYDANSNRRTLELSFSTLSQSTQTEIPRRAQVVAIQPEGTQQIILLVGSASDSRWRKSGADATMAQVMASFRAVPAPKSNLKLRVKPRNSSLL